MNTRIALTKPTTTGAGARTTLVSVALLITLLFSACSLGQGGAAADPDTDGLGGQAAGEANGLDGATYTSGSARAIVNVDQIGVFDSPNGSSILTMPATTTYGTARVFLVESMAGDWVRVRLPMRPNHQSGWVRAADVTLEEVEPIVHVDLATRTLTVVAGGDIVTQATVAVGSDENPTPTGTFYITDKLETPNPDGAYGPFALGLSGYSETLSEFGGGDGQIGIHGTDSPELLGQAVSHGCIRLPNDVVTWLAGLLPLGTPVHIV